MTESETIRRTVERWFVRRRTAEYAAGNLSGLWGGRASKARIVRAILEYRDAVQHATAAESDMFALVWDAEALNGDQVG